MRIVEIQSLAPWRVTIHPTLTEAEYLAVCRGKNQATDASFRTVGLALGWIKRLAKSSPDSSSSFHVLPWAGTYAIYFG